MRTTTLKDAEGRIWNANHNSDWSGAVFLSTLDGDRAVTVPGSLVKAIGLKIVESAVTEVVESGALAELLCDKINER